MLDVPDPRPEFKGANKKITYDKQGDTNNTIVFIDGVRVLLRRGASRPPREEREPAARPQGQPDRHGLRRQEGPRHAARRDRARPKRLPGHLPDLVSRRELRRLADQGRRPLHARHLHRRQRRRAVHRPRREGLHQGHAGVQRRGSPAVPRSGGEPRRPREPRHGGPPRTEEHPAAGCNQRGRAGRRADHALPAQPGPPGLGRPHGIDPGRPAGLLRRPVLALRHYDEQRRRAGRRAASATWR